MCSVFASAKVDESVAFYESFSLVDGGGLPPFVFIWSNKSDISRETEIRKKIESS